MTRLLSYPTTVPADAVPQNISSRIASRKQPNLVSRARSARRATVLKFGYSWKDWEFRCEQHGGFYAMPRPNRLRPR